MSTGTSAASTQDDSFESWEPDRFERDAFYQKTIRRYTSGLIEGDVLDVGCGSRVFYDLSKAKSWTGMDISERMLSGIEFVDDIKDTKVIQGDVLEIPYPDNSFDTVTCMFLLHHLGRWNRSQSAERVTAAMTEIYRVLRPGGRLVVGEVSPGPGEWPYHWFFPAFFALGRMVKTEMPYFWQQKKLAEFGEKSGFDEPLWIRIPVRDAIYQPILRVTLPAWVLGPWLLSMNLISFEKAPEDSSASTTR